MSLSEFRDDEYHFLNYTIEEYNRGNGPPLISKKSRLIAAATQNDLSALKELLDSPKWYEVQDKLGLNLLQIAILRDDTEVFDYLLSLDDFPLEAVNDKGDTALVVALCYHVPNDPDAVSTFGIKAFQAVHAHLTDIHKSPHKHYSYELIKKGANIDKTTRKGDPLLHCALSKGKRFLSVAQLLLEKGADINAQNSTGKIPLQVSDDEEVVTMLLCYGADASKLLTNSDSTLFDRFLEWESKNRLQKKVHVALENLLYFTHDEWNLCKINSNVLFGLLAKRSPILYHVLNLTSEIFMDYNIPARYSLLLLTIDLDYLRIFIEKFPNFVKAVLQNYKMTKSLNLIIDCDGPIRLENLDMLLHSSLCSDTIEFIFQLNYSSTRMFVWLLKCLWLPSNVEPVKMIYYLLSYGMPLYEEDLDDIYDITGYSEDFKNLLFMDLNREQENREITKIIPRLLYDITLNLYNSVRKSSWYSVDWNQLFAYYAHPKFQEIYFDGYWRKTKRVHAVEKQLPEIPLLQELARDTFRKYFIEIFKIKSAKKFYSLMKLLPVNNVYKKIITFETKLYYLKE